MKEHAGERLFEAIGQIPDQMVLEAAQDEDSSAAAGWANYEVQPQPPDAARQEAVSQEHKSGPDDQAQLKAAGSDRKRRRQATVAKLNGYLKYLPVAACLCMVLAGAGYVVNHFITTDQDSSIPMSGSLESASDDAGQITEKEVVTMDQAADAEGGMNDQTDLEESADVQAAILPVRYDAYEGPVFPLTATGDTQKLKVSRSLRASVHTQEQGDTIQPLLQVTDTYQMKNTSKQDKTLQLVYPFVTTLNRAFAMDGSMLQIKDQEQAEVTYSIGESIQAYRHADASEPAAMEDYRQIFAEETDYQEQALAKEADWERLVRVYTFSDVQVQEGATEANASGVIGVTVNGAQADVLTYGFDHSFTRDDGSRNYCFFIPQEEKKLLLIVTGEMEGEPEPEYYANLDCEEKITGVTCRMDWQEMTYGDALRLCSKDAARNLRQDYEQGLYDAKLPEYMDEDAAYRILTMISEEDDFYRILTQRYENTELTEVFERMFGETRVVYAMATVTIPAKETVRVVVQTQKRQNTGNYLLLTKPDRADKDRTNAGGVSDDEGENDAEVPAEMEADTGEAYAYDFLSAAQSRLRLKKTDFRLELSEEWEILRENCGLEQKRDGIWKGQLSDEDQCVVITGDERLSMTE